MKQTPEPSALFVGAVGCKSSSCHGGAGEKRSQYITWSRQDFHTRAFAILLDARSARIAETVGTGEAQSSARCTVCHSPFQSVASMRLASNARADEGVSCESCHGAAGSWLRGHTRSDWNYAMRVTAGMRDLRSLYVRANTCVACHQSIDNDLLKAGHPPLVFELDSQSVNEPKHWRDDNSWIGPRAWLTGQAVALREAAWRSRTDSDPAADVRETSIALAWLLAKATAVEPDLPKIFESVSSDLEPVQKQADDLARRAPSWNPNIGSIMAMLRAFVAADSEFVVTKEASVQTLWYRARRVVLALDRLSAALKQNRGEPIRIDSELNLLREDVRLHENFAAARFAEHLRGFRAALTK
ncbi:MAG TPA: multiheme c-type cytochrome [Chthoniobacterales bacterium]|nr:multiheme c-type cytochrome [Chthoniobacterales bacterium]